MNESSISIVVPTFERDDDLFRLLESIGNSDYDKKLIEIIVVDNSQNGNLRPALLRLEPKIIIIEPTKNTYSNGGRKLGAAAANNDYIFLIDDDNVIDGPTIRNLASALDGDSTLGVVAPVMCYLSRPDIIWCAGGEITNLGLTRYHMRGRKLSELGMGSSGQEPDFFPNAFMTRKKLIGAVGLDVKNFPHNWAEPDFCLRVKSTNHRLETIRTAVIWHDIDYVGGTTRIGIDKTYDQARSRLAFRKKHQNTLSTWAKFWMIVFPLSTVAYARKILAQNNISRTKLIKAYFKGTRDGVMKKIEQ